MTNSTGGEWSYPELELTSIRTTPLTVGFGREIGAGLTIPEVRFGAWSE